MAISSIAVDGVALADADYEREGRDLYRVIDGERRGWTGRSVVVEYSAGWTLPTDQQEGNLPADIERAVIRLVGSAVSVSGRDPTIKSEDVPDVGSVSYYVQGASAALADPEAESLLQPYRRLLFA